MENAPLLVPLVILVPALGTFINFFWGAKMGERAAGYIAVAAAAFTFFVSMWIFGYLNASHGLPVVVDPVPFFNGWLRIGADMPVNMPWQFRVDTLTGNMLLVVTGVGTLIHIYSVGYIHGDPKATRFFAYLNMFLAFMLILVTGNNLLMMFVGWEGVGLCSYLLIGYYFDRTEAANASRKAFITNRVGDFGFALAIFGVIATFGSAQYIDVFNQARAYPIELIGHWGILSWIALGLFIGACGKSAQLPLHVWLPDAMAGPTPVSALIHAATMVTAGLYMVTRTNVIFQHSQTMLLVVALVGAATAIFAATIGITQNDIKKVLAYSTVSQLGFMFMACGVGAFAIGIFHVMTHAFFKALMFLGAGSVIHGMHHEQDMRRMGGLKKYMPYTYWTFFAGWLAICGIIPFSGFWSKDEILWKAASTTFIPYGWLVWLVGTIAATCTAFYMTRLMAMTFWGKEKFLGHVAGGEADEAHASAYDKGLTQHDAFKPSAGDRHRHQPGEHVGPTSPGHGVHLPHESPRAMWVPLVVLAVLATIGGFVGVGPAFRFVTGVEHPGGKLNIVRWLDPIIWNPATREFGTVEEAHATNAPAATHSAESAAGEATAAETTPTYGNVGFVLTQAVEHSLHNELLTEWIFIVISLVVAGVGMLLGYLFYVKNTSLADIWASRLRPVYNASYNKYWVDEFYGWAITRRTMDLARAVYAVDSRFVDGIVNGIARLSQLFSRIVGGFDKYFVDGLVNSIAAFIYRLMSPLFRAAQTGFTQNYALVMVVGLMIAVVIFFAADFVKR